MDKELNYILRLEAKKYTKAEIRAMFEKSNAGFDLSKSSYRAGQYLYSTIEIMYRAYEQAFDDLGLWEE